MELETFKQQAIEKTLELIDEPPDNWKTFNDKLNTYIIDDRHPMRSDIRLKLEEIPILECILDESFVLITTERIVSKSLNDYDEIPLRQISGFGNEFEEENYNRVEGKPPKTNLILVKGENGKKLIFQIDSYHPAHFAKTLITNLANYVKCGEWFWNPKPRK